MTKKLVLLKFEVLDWGVYLCCSVSVGRVYERLALRSFI